MHHEQYNAYYDRKKAHKLNKAIARRMNVPVSPLVLRKISRLKTSGSLTMLGTCPLRKLWMESNPHHTHRLVTVLHLLELDQVLILQAGVVLHGTCRLLLSLFGVTMPKGESEDY